MRPLTTAALGALALLACEKQATEPSKKEAAASTAVAAPAAPVAAGTDWVDPQKLMSIHFPGKPNDSEQEADTPIGPVKVTMAMQADGARAYMATATIYKLPGGASFDVARALDGARDGMLGNIKGKATGEKPIQLDGFDGREVSFEAPGPAGQTIRGTARVFAGSDPASAYLACAFRMTDEPDANATPFLDSVHIGKGAHAK